jgi:hypothetical protein
MRMKCVEFSSLGDTYDPSRHGNREPNQWLWERGVGMCGQVHFRVIDDGGTSGGFSLAWPDIQ